MALSQDITQDLILVVQKLTGFPPELQHKVFQSFMIIVILWIAQRLIKWATLRRVDDIKLVYRWKKVIAYTAFTLGFFLVGKVWFVGVGAIATFLGLLSAGLAIAFKDPLVNLAGWAFILIRQPFTVGDRIQVGQHSGDVIDQRLFCFSLMEIGHWVDAEQSTGRMILVPNGLVFTEPIANYFKGFQHIWLEIPVLITFESDWRKAKGILTEIANEYGSHISKNAEKRIKAAARKVMIFYNKLTPVVYTDVKDCGILLTIRCLCEPRRNRGATQAIWESILTEFEKYDDIDFAYPTQRIYYNAIEGKPDARAFHPGMPLVDSKATPKPQSVTKPNDGAPS